MFGHRRQRRARKKRFSRGKGRALRHQIHSHVGLTLLDVLPGQKAQVLGFESSIPKERREHLLAYGLVPGYCVEVVQHSPVTIIRVEHTELALEGEIASKVKVGEIKWI